MKDNKTIAELTSELVAQVEKLLHKLVPRITAVLAEPEAAEPEAAEPEAAEPDAAEPDAAEPDAAEPDAAKPDAAEPDAAEPDAAEPDAAEPDAAEPEAEKSSAGHALARSFNTIGSFGLRIERRNVSMFEKLRLYLMSFSLILGSLSIVPAAPAQDSIYSFGGDAAFASKYIWRGQRLTNDWSLQPAATVGIGNFSFNAWGSLDITAVNEGDALPIPENPFAPDGASGLKGKFSEIDYTFSYSHSLESVSIDGGVIFYTFPERSASLPSTTEVYAGVTFDNIMLAPSGTFYIDVNETGQDGGRTGFYFLLAAGHSFATNSDVVSAIDLSASLSLANSGFGEYYYGASETGIHDFNLTVSVPFTLNDEWSASAFVSYSALLGEFRYLQYLDPRDVYKGTAGDPKNSADTLWGGVAFSLASPLRIRGDLRLRRVGEVLDLLPFPN